MYIYNVTINIEESVAEKWLRWMQEVHINEMLTTSKFSEAKMSQVMVEEEMGGLTYSVQYTTDSKETLEKYYKEDADRLREETNKLFQGKFVAFRTELKVMHHVKNFEKS